MGESSTAVGDMVDGSWGILDVDNMEGRGGGGMCRWEKDERRMGK